MAGLSADRPSEVVLAARVARQFYLEGVSKVDIADRLGISRFRVARLSAELCSALGLKHAFVFNFPDDEPAFGDLGALLAGEIRARLSSWGVPLLEPAAGIRATVIGASQYTIQVSGSTIYLSPIDAVPVRNVPVVAPTWPPYDMPT